METVSRIPASLSRGVASSFTRSGIRYDYAIAGMPFLSGASNSRPIRRQTAPYRKNQFDASYDPGEQTLDGWWRRSQSSFHAGAGVLVFDPIRSWIQDSAASLSQSRFSTSAGVDPWTPGVLKLLKKSTKVAVGATGDTFLTLGYHVGSADGLIISTSAGNLVKAEGDPATVTTVAATTDSVLSMCSDGTYVYFADNGNIKKMDIASGTLSTVYLINGAGAFTPTHRVVVAWVKQRLMAAIDNKLYELDATASSAALPTTPNYAHPNPAWTWTSITEGPAAIYAAGHLGTSSAIYRLTLTSSGVVPTLTSAVISPQMPEGEIVYSIYGYAGSYVGVGTSNGFRVGQLSSSGDILLGPLVFQASSPVKAINGYDRFFYFAGTNAIDGNSGLFRVDLGTEIRPGRFAYASDLQAHVTGEVNSICQFGTSGRMAFGVAGAGSYLEHSTDLEPSGYLQTGRIRYHTVELKAFRGVKIRGPQLQGSLSVAYVEPESIPVNMFTFGKGDDPDAYTLYISVPPREYISLRFTLDADTVTPSQGAQIGSYQLQALPAAKRQRLITIPLLCYDFEKDQNGARRGGKGRALKRLEALEAIEEIGDIVKFTDLRSKTEKTVVIEALDFIQEAPPGPGNEGWGGVIMATLRTAT